MNDITLKRTLAPMVLTGIGMLAVFLWARGGYNELVFREETVKTAWSQVENQYQRRMDLIPNLVSTVKGYAAHERETLESVVKARADAAGAAIDPAALDEAALRRFQDSQAALGGALSRLLLVVERYPDLKSSETFTTLMVQLEGTENRISVERKRFNEAVQLYNTGLRAFPGNILASAFGFTQRPYFAAESGADRAPDADFSGDGK